MIPTIKSILSIALSKLAAFLLPFFLGREWEKKKKAEQDAKALQDRIDVIDNITRLDSDERRRMLDKWSRDVSGLDADTPDK